MHLDNNVHYDIQRRICDRSEIVYLMNQYFNESIITLKYAVIKAVVYLQHFQWHLSFNALIYHHHKRAEPVR